MKKLFLAFSMVLFGVFAFNAQNITITDDETHVADPSAMLDVYSVNKGMLVPRMTEGQRLMIATPAPGLLVFDTDHSSFFFFNGTDWINLSAAASGEFWSMNTGTGHVYLTQSDKNVGIGTDEPLSKLAVVGNTGANPDEALFEVRDEYGLPIFTVTSEGVRFYVKE